MAGLERRPAAASYRSVAETGRGRRVSPPSRVQQPVSGGAGVEGLSLAQPIRGSESLVLGGRAQTHFSGYALRWVPRGDEGFVSTIGSNAGRAQERAAVFQTPVPERGATRHHRKVVVLRAA